MNYADHMTVAELIDALRSNLPAEHFVKLGRAAADRLQIVKSQVDAANAAPKPQTHIPRWMTSDGKWMS